MFGFLNVNKPAGRTSHDVVSKARRLLRIKQIGHAGTLDPAATGVLPLGIGTATRLLRFLPHDKTYVAEILLGVSTSSDDTQGEVLQTADVTSSEEEVTRALMQFKGEITQIPPMVSAIHIDGERLYKLVREGRAPAEIPSRSVTVYRIEVLGFNSPRVIVRIHCSGGTYIRSIARDLGQALGCGGCLSSLLREQAGRFSLATSVDLDTVGDAASVPLLRPEAVLTLPVANIDSTQADRLRMGQKIEAIASGQPDSNAYAATDANEFVMALLDGNLIAVCKNEAPFLQPEVVLNR